MRLSSSHPLSDPASDPSDFSATRLDPIVIFPDGSVTWAVEPPLERIPMVDCEVVPEYQPLPVDLLRSPHPHHPELFMTAPEFTPVGVLKSVGR
jgi:hypothetical protein